MLKKRLWVFMADSGVRDRQGVLSHVDLGVKDGHRALSHRNPVMHRSWCES